MPEYTPTDARRDALRAISDNVFSVKVSCEKDGENETLWINVIANDSTSALDKASEYCRQNNYTLKVTTAYSTLNAIEETIK